MGGAKENMGGSISPVVPPLFLSPFLSSSGLLSHNVHASILSTSLLLSL